MYLPVARREALTVRELPEETLIYDQRVNKAHCLNRTTALVWRHCDGSNTIAELVVRLRRDLGIEEPEAAVHLALEQLSSRNLLEKPVPALADRDRAARRALLKKLAVAAALPVVLSITAKAARAASSPPTCSIQCTYDATGHIAGMTAGSCPAGLGCGAGCNSTGPASSTQTVTGACTT